MTSKLVSTCLPSRRGREVRAGTGLVIYLYVCAMPTGASTGAEVVSRHPASRAREKKCASIRRSGRAGGTPARTILSATGSSRSNTRGWRRRGGSTHLRYMLLKQCWGSGSGSACFWGLQEPDPLVRGSYPDPSLFLIKVLIAD
jgi:hypothetical protein